MKGNIQGNTVASVDKGGTYPFLPEDNQDPAFYRSSHSVSLSCRASQPLLTDPSTLDTKRLNLH
ncbi:hypothetical protein E2C01_074505 [Portunus trituberculatus]|uniref:Uncharacterized protein n=1 Tax=Portunus trituberculatus TaxID=210409 RepID=A0A5B7ICM9_PORTR|nr:hypothetical protein [Portunus trituberculatus]